MGNVKMTLDLPDELVKQLKLRAVLDGKKLKDAFADALRAGLVTGGDRAARGRVVVRKDRKTGLPVIHSPADAPVRHMTAAELLLLERESVVREDLDRLGLSV